VNFNEVIVTILVQDLDRAIHFYRDLLGFTVAFEQEDWAVFVERVGLMLAPEPLPQENLNLNAVTVTLMVNDAHAAYHELIAKGVAFLVGPTDVGGAVVASFRDTEGNLLQLVETQVG
jgi:predicted enzyme related to lactoylglutathione lyase